MLMRDANFDPVKFAKTELNPLVDELIAHAERDEASDQLTYFSGIKGDKSPISGAIISARYQFHSLIIRRRIQQQTLKKPPSNSI